MYVHPFEITPPFYPTKAAIFYIPPQASILREQLCQEDLANIKCYIGPTIRLPESTSSRVARRCISSLRCGVAYRNLSPETILSNDLKLSCNASTSAPNESQGNGLIKVHHGSESGWISSCSV